MKEQVTITVSIICDAFNQQRYIEQCLDGFVMQQTDFAFEVLVHDDASTDGTADIIHQYAERYPDLIKPILQTENKYSQGISIWMTYQLPRARGKYIAFCEGDDFWTDPLKLQKQVAFLEENEEYGLSYTRTLIVNQDGETGDVPCEQGQHTSFVELMRGYNNVPTASTLFRRDDLMNYFARIRPTERGWRMGDFPMVLYFFREAKVHFLNEVTCAYRVLPNSASHSDDEIRLLPYYFSILDIKLFFYLYFDLKDKRLLKDIIKEHHRLLRDKYRSHTKGIQIRRLTTALPFSIRVEYMKGYLKGIMD